MTSWIQKSLMTRRVNSYASSSDGSVSDSPFEDTILQNRTSVLRSSSIFTFTLEGLTHSTACGRRDRISRIRAVAAASTSSGSMVRSLMMLRRPLPRSGSSGYQRVSHRLIIPRRKACSNAMTSDCERSCCLSLDAHHFEATAASSAHTEILSTTTFTGEALVDEDGEVLMGDLGELAEIS